MFQLSQPRHYRRARPWKSGALAPRKPHDINMPVEEPRQVQEYYAGAQTVRVGVSPIRETAALWRSRLRPWLSLGWDGRGRPRCRIAALGRRQSETVCCAKVEWRDSGSVTLCSDHQTTCGSGRLAAFKNPLDGCGPYWHR